MAFLTQCPEPQIVEILNYRIELFTIDFLLEKLEMLINGLKANPINVDISYLKIGSDR